MKKYIIMALTVSLFVFSNAFSETCDSNSYCTYFVFKNINPDTAQLNVTGSADEYDNGFLTSHPPTDFNINKNAEWIDASDPEGWRLDTDMDWISTGGTDFVKKSYLKINSVNGFVFANCQANHELIMGPGKDIIIITHNEDNTYSCQVKLGDSTNDFYASLYTFNVMANQ